MSRRDDEALEEVLSEIRRNKTLKNRIVQAARRQDFENFAQMIRQVLRSIGRSVDNFANFVNNAYDWFRSF